MGPTCPFWVPTMLWKGSSIQQNLVWVFAHLDRQLLISLSLSVQLYSNRVLYWVLLVNVWVLPGPTRGSCIQKMSFGGVLIQTGNFYFHCHGWFSLHKFSNTYGSTDARRENPYNIEVGRTNLKMVWIPQPSFWKTIVKLAAIDREIAKVPNATLLE